MMAMMMTAMPARRCAVAVCGDGVVQEGSRPAMGNGVDTDGCLSTCVVAMRRWRCGSARSLR